MGTIQAYGVIWDANMKKDAEFENLMKFMDFYATTVNKIDPSADYHPSNVLKNLIYEKGEKIALKGLKMAVNDMVLDSFSLVREDVKKIDNLFIKNGVASLSSMRKKCSNKFKKIVDRKKINKIEEYYLIKEICEDPTFDGDNENKNNLLFLLEGFEKNLG